MLTGTIPTEFGNLSRLVVVCVPRACIPALACGPRGASIVHWWQPTMQVQQHRGHTHSGSERTTACTARSSTTTKHRPRKALHGSKHGSECSELLDS